MVKDLPYASFDSKRDDQTAYRFRLVAAKLIEWRVAGWLSRRLYQAADKLDARS